MTNELIKSLLDESFRVLQHDSDEAGPEYAHLRETLGKSFRKVLKNTPTAQPYAVVLDDERARQQPKHLIKDLQRYEGEDYGHYDTRKAWAVWQARAASPQADCAHSVPVEEVIERFEREHGPIPQATATQPAQMEALEQIIELHDIPVSEGKAVSAGETAMAKIAASPAAPVQPFVFPPMPQAVVIHDKLGPMFDRLAMHFYADKCMALARGEK